MFPTSHCTTDSGLRQLQLWQLSSWRGRAEGATASQPVQPLQWAGMGQALETSDQQISTDLGQFLYLSFQQYRIRNALNPNLPTKAAGISLGLEWLPDGYRMVQCLTVWGVLPLCQASAAETARPEGLRGQGQIILQGSARFILGEWSSHVLNELSCPSNILQSHAKPYIWCIMVLWKFVNSWVCVGSKVCGSKTRKIETDAPPQPDHAKG